MQAKLLRLAMRLAFFLRDCISPRKCDPTFTQKIPSQYGLGPGQISLHFYTPPSYRTRRRHGHQFPVVVNFHGGGFCLGTATDDGGWARVVLKELQCVLVSVGYRRAPEYPYPAAVDDSVTALRYLEARASDLSIDMSKVVLSGFNAGANLAFSLPLRLFSDQHDGNCRGHGSDESATNIIAIVAFYPLLDWSTSRDSKRRRSKRPDKTLPKFLTDLIDHSYLPAERSYFSPGDELSTAPTVSPALAPDDWLKHGLPNNIQFILCGWDMLLDEGQTFAKRLRQLGKTVDEVVIPEVVHGWDKNPNPLFDTESIDAIYTKACRDLLTTFRTIDGES